MQTLRSLKCDTQKCTEKRQVLETARSAKVARLRKDVERIAKRELEFAKTVVEVLVPVKITWDAEAWNRVKDFIPVRVERVDSVPVVQPVTEEKQ